MRPPPNGTSPLFPPRLLSPSLIFPQVDGQLDDRRIHVPAALHAVLNGHAEECHEGRWFGAAAAAGS